jgi:hypothetical protein
VSSEEKLFPVPSAVERATGYRSHPSSCHRWRTSGVSGVRLETTKCGGKRLTSVEAVHRFNEAVTRAGESDHASTAQKQGGHR